jgi:hypothetical protein
MTQVPAHGARQNDPSPGRVLTESRLRLVRIRDPGYVLFEYWSFVAALRYICALLIQ